MRSQAIPAPINRPIHVCLNIYFLPQEHHRKRRDRRNATRRCSAVRPELLDIECLCEDALGFNKVGRIETLTEPGIDRGEKGCGLVIASLVGVVSRECQCCPQFR